MCSSDLSQTPEMRAKVETLRADLEKKLDELRVSCPTKRADAVQSAAEALAVAKAVAKASPTVAKASKELTAALSAFVGYQDARAAIRAAEKSVPVMQAREHVKQVLAEQVDEQMKDILAAVEKDPRVIQARKDLAAARTPEAVTLAQEKLANARSMCTEAEKALRRTFKANVGLLKQDKPVPRLEELLSDAPPATVSSRRPS